MEYSSTPAFKFSVKAILSTHDSKSILSTSDTKSRKRKLNECHGYANIPSPPHISTHYLPPTNYNRQFVRSRSLTPPQLTSRYSPPVYYRNDSFTEKDEKYCRRSNQFQFSPYAPDINGKNSAYVPDINGKNFTQTKKQFLNQNQEQNKLICDNDKKVVEKRSSPTGRFRPPPFFDTVLILRKRLFELGGKDFDKDEPPSDRNVHKLWRAVEKYKVDYSLQHYFYVASLSNRCFDLVERIHQKVSRGLIEGSRDKEVNQSYFNFLYGKNEAEQYRLLLLLESGEMTPKDFSKVKKTTSAKTLEQNSNCNQCGILIKKLSEEKEGLETKYKSLRQQYEKLLLEQSNTSQT